jgi:hypothetical protein
MKNQWQVLAVTPRPGEPNDFKHLTHSRGGTTGCNCWWGYNWATFFRQTHGYANGRRAAVANARAINLQMGQRCRPPRNNGRNGAIRFATRDRSGRPRRSRLGTFRHLGTPAYAATASGTVQFSRVVQSVGDALELCAGLTRFGRRGEAARCGQEDTGGTRAAFRTGRRQFAFRHRSHLCERPALLAHIFVRRHRPPASGLSASCGGPVRRDCGNYTS